ncbi:MAG: hypothetical protein HFG54_04535 [Lachnospiraceae bacterium]|jgi:hypothetical protein|nr:hypothetical protein [Lachnospiraceae bacterium]
MRRTYKKQAEDFIKLLEQVHTEIKKSIEAKKYNTAMELLGQCQEGAIGLGNLIEKEEGEDFVTIPLLQSYCEVTYQLYKGLYQKEDLPGNRAYKNLKKALIQIENSVRNDIKGRLEIVFLPYKASMWDSMESVWQAAAADPDCSTYVVPIPYYERNEEGVLNKYCYEGDQMPDYVPVTSYNAYNFKDQMPDVIYIHNPYDQGNYVTSIDPRFYSGELKKCTSCLVYIPYYSTAGGMGEGQSLCQAYFNVDHIVVQSKKFIKFFDPVIPEEKFLPLGSPKFDRVIQMCSNPPKAPESWKKKMEGRKVYFYNTSINGMLADTKTFLKKMEYVFQCFENRPDSCLLWRPHPLLESTFASMRKEYKPWYDRLKKQFADANLGIYDDTSDITSTIALSDAYIGDAGTSVTSLFGIVGKPLFIFNNQINTLPQSDDWRGEKINLALDVWENDRYQITQNNQLWFSEKNDYHYKFYMDLGTGYSGGSYYIRALEIKDKIYVLPGNAQNLLIIENKKIRRIDFKTKIPQPGAFYSYWYNEKYIFLIPFQYPLLLRFNIETEELQGIEGIRPFNVRNINGEWRAGGVGIYGNELVFASPKDNEFIFIDINTLRARGLCSHSHCNLGTQGIINEGDELWLMPMNGMTITCWNPKTGQVREYDDLPGDFKSVRWPQEQECRERPFLNLVFWRVSGKENIVIAPCWGNMYLTLDRETGKMEKWEPPVPFVNRGKNGYFAASGMGSFCVTYPRMGKADCRIWYAPERKLYDINIDTKEYKEIEINFDYQDLREHECGFMEESEWMQYCLNESAFNSLKDFLDGRITGNPFDRERQIRAFSKINASTDGACGKRIHRFVKGRLGDC